MRDLQKTIDYVERGMLRGLEHQRPSPAARGMMSASPTVSAPKSSSIRAWHAPVSATEARQYYPERVFKPSPSSRSKPTMTATPTMTTSTTAAPAATTPTSAPNRNQLTISAKSVKVTVPLDPAEIKALPPLHDQDRVKLAVSCDGRLYTADIATKSLRKAKSTINASGVENIFCMIHGKLQGNEIVECGLVAQVKVKPPVK
jgi:hypothetical protein